VGSSPMRRRSVTGSSRCRAESRCSTPRWENCCVPRTPRDWRRPSRPTACCWIDASWTS
jgi:hypothetical protein